MSKQHGSVLDKTFYTERFFYRHHRIIGATLSAAALYGLITLVQLSDTLAIARALGLPFDVNINTLIVQTTRTVLLVWLAVAIVFAIIVFFRPSLLKRVEKQANRLF